MSEYWDNQKRSPVIGKEFHKPRESAEKNARDSLKSLHRPWLSVIRLATQPVLGIMLRPDPIEKELRQIIAEDTVPTDDEIILIIEQMLDLDAGLKDITGKSDEEGEKYGNGNEK